MPRWIPFALVGLLACGDAREVTIVASIPGADTVEAPVAGLAIALLPYDRDSVIASFEARAATPRPHTGALDTLFQRFREPFVAYTLLRRRAGHVADSLVALRADAAGDAARIERLRADSAALVPRVEAARVALDRARRAFVGRSDSLRAVVRRWEDSTYRGYEAAVRDLARSLARDPVSDTTGPDGRTTLPLPAGDWWVYARSWDPFDPNAEWYWNLPVTGDTIRLDARSGRRLPKY